MTTLRKSKTAAVEAFEETYRTALVAHLQDPSEATLGQAYELGREAIREGKSLLDTLSIHHRAYRDLLDGTDSLVKQQERLTAAADFLSETLSPFEMTHRGFREAVQALRQMNETLEDQIKRLAYSVHDEAGQLLVVVHLELAEIAKDIREHHQEKLARVNRVLKEIEDQLRRFSHELRPTILDDLGWLPAIQDLVANVSARNNLSIKIDATTKDRLPSLQETILYRVIQESLTNVAKHAQATCVRISVRRRRNLICCSVEDNGSGCDLQVLKSSRKSAGLGLTAMRERLRTVGGTLQIDSAPGKGTKILVEFPLEVTHDRTDRSGG